MIMGSHEEGNKLALAFQAAKVNVLHSSITLIAWLGLWASIPSRGFESPLRGQTLVSERTLFRGEAGSSKKIWLLGLSVLSLRILCPTFRWCAWVSYAISYTIAFPEELKLWL